VADRSVALVLTAAGAAHRDTGSRLFPGVPSVSLTREEFRPREPFRGRLFGLLGSQPRGVVVALVVPVVRAEGAEDQPAASGDVGGPTVPIADHVDLEACGPLTGRWPPGVPRDFPSMTGIYQPGLVRPPGGARVYSSGVVAAGVADVRRLTRFEARAVREGGWPVTTDSLVPAAIVAAYYGLRLAACGVLQAVRSDRE
jgi:hypothetical protein